MNLEPKDKIAAWMRDEYETVIFSTVNMTVGDSPIENALFCAIDAVCEARGYDLRRFNGNFDDAVSVHKRTGAPVVWASQAAILKYKADFLFVSFDEDGGVTRFLAVECDGHDYHERTKEQAAHDRKRDRRFQELGYSVYRFTGSEIFRDPIGCAKQIVTRVFHA